MYKLKHINAVKTGDLILSEEPFAYVLSSKEKGSRCDFCLEKGKVLKCSGCQFVHYCNRSCQKDAWEDHKWECANLKRIAPKTIPDAARLLARILNRLQRGNGGAYKAFYTPTSFRVWKDLMSHYSDLKSDKKRMDHFSTLSMVLFEYLKDISLPNTADLMGLYGRMVINSFTILDIEMNSIGTGIYLASSVIDHSCNPNAVAVFDGKTINIRALKDMNCLDWKKIRISYIDLMKTPYERQMELRQSYYFLCQCDRCLDENRIKYVHAAKCLKDGCEHPVNIKWRENLKLVEKIEKEKAKENGAGDTIVSNGCSEPIFNGILPLPDGSVYCGKCGTEFMRNDLDKFMRTMEESEVNLENMKETSVAYVDICKHLIPCFRFYYGETHPLLGLLHIKYGKILLYKMNLAGALKQFKCAEKIIKITHGEKHPLYKNHLLPLMYQAIVESE
nr:LOW QUALITY PROTEIN: histone-lysine N-methyltransferase SMYD3 [Danaus plexippus plexippus]